MSGFIAVHVGAGYHSENLRSAYKKTCQRACAAAVRLLRGGSDAVEAVTEAVAVLEDCPLTNAGIGSNISLKGTVECDASIMDGDSLNYGSVGALSNIKNPIKVARTILRDQKKELSFCRVPPCMLVGQGALDWALEHGFEFFSASHMTTQASEKTYLRNSRLIEKDKCPNASMYQTPVGTNFLQLNSKSLPGSDHSSSPMIDCYQMPVVSSPSNRNSSNSSSKDVFNYSLLDTVGAVCVDSFGNVSSAVSSGGLLLKLSGRIGQASIFGSGCWAQNSSEAEGPSMACSVTGVGEHLIKTSFAKEWCKMLHLKNHCVSALPDIFRGQLLENVFLKGERVSKLAGVLTLKHYSDENLCELSWVHNTKTMIIGYASTEQEKPVSVLSMQPEGSLVEKSIVGSERCVRLRS